MASGPPSGDEVLRLEGVSKDYGTEVVVRVLHGVDLAVRRGEFAALIGPSGSGKSTLLNLVGLLDRPTEGRVWLAGQDTSALDDGALGNYRGRTLGFVFQFHHLLPAFTALENVMMPLYADRGWPEPWMEERALGLLARVGLGPLARRRATQLSGGQQQRVAVARALVANPTLVLADEPTGNLDTHSSDEIFALLRGFAEEQRTTFLVVTHDPRLADRCDRIVRLVDGRIVSDVPHRPGSGAEGSSRPGPQGGGSSPAAG
jgi:lipoprotein-releasing system ATP-binding protein